MASNRETIERQLGHGRVWQTVMFLSHLLAIAPNQLTADLREAETEGVVMQDEARPGFWALTVRAMPGKIRETLPIPEELE